MLSEWMRARTGWLVVPLGRLLAKSGMSPNTLTIVGFFLNAGVAILLAKGYLRVGGVCAIISSFFDSLDGSLARESAQISKFGGFLDSVVDRFSEAAIFLGLLFYSLSRGDTTNVVLIYLAIVGSLLVSYARARAESASIDCKVGMFSRFERVVVLIAGLILVQVRLALWILAILSNITVLQRMYHVWQATKESGT